MSAVGCTRKTVELVKAPPPLKFWSRPGPRHRAVDDGQGGLYPLPPVGVALVVGPPAPADVALGTDPGGPPQLA